MTTIHHVRHSGAAPFFLAAASRAIAPIRKVTAAIALARTRNALHRLDDRMLKDIGLVRSDIGRIFRLPSS